MQETGVVRLLNLHQEFAFVAGAQLKINRTVPSVRLTAQVNVVRFTIAVCYRPKKALRKFLSLKENGLLCTETIS